jgi:hypothetical protein
MDSDSLVQGQGLTPDEEGVFISPSQSSTVCYL